MILVNGHIEPKIETGGGLDEDGNPVPTISSWGDKIPCRYTPNRNSLKGKANGNLFIVASYEILIERQPFTTEQIRLTGINGEDLGELSIMWVETFDAVNALKITA